MVHLVMFCLFNGLATLHIKLKGRDPSPEVIHDSNMALPPRQRRYNMSFVRLPVIMICMVLWTCQAISICFGKQLQYY